MRFWRIASNVPGAYGADDLSGEGARRHGGRWNSVGVSAVYASLNVGAAVLEILAHLGKRRQPTDRYLVAIDVPDRYGADPASGIMSYAASELPSLWNAQPVHQVSQLWGDERLKMLSPVRRGTPLPSMGFIVPSVLVEEERNLVLNPAHPWLRRHVRATIIRPFVFDRRLAFSE